jgi:putative oxidoreductase
MTHSFFTFRKDISFLLRIYLGFMMVWHTYDVLFGGGMGDYIKYVDKVGIPFAGVLGYLSKIFEFLGGIMLILGFFTRIGAAMIAIVLAVAVFWVSRNNILGGGGLALTYLMISLVIFCSPPTKFSVDQVINKKISS